MASNRVRYGVFSDTHGNLQALETILLAFERAGVSKIFHCGDCLCMGPNPFECVEKILSAPNLYSVKGNHDLDYINDARWQMPTSHVSGRHKEWTFDSMGGRYKKELEELPYIIEEEVFGLKITFAHYAIMANGKKFWTIDHNATAAKMDEMFQGVKGDLVFFGHRHQQGEIIGNKVYIDVGSVGCHKQSYATGILLDIYEDSSYVITRINVKYDRQSVIDKLNNQQIPGRNEIISNYFNNI